MNSLSPNLFDGIRLANLEKQLGLRQIHVYQEGFGEVEHAFRASTRENLYSGSKTYTALAIGMAEAEGRLKLDELLIDFFPEFVEEQEMGKQQGSVPEGFDKVTLRHLLHMHSGKAEGFFREKSVHGKEGSKLASAEQEDYAARFFAEGLDHAPASRFAYNNLNSYMLGRVIHKVSGENLREYLIPRLFAPQGIANPQWDSCPRGFNMGASGLRLKTSEYAKLGRLLLQEGEWEGQQLVPADYIRRMHEDIVPTKDVELLPETTQGYGYQLWICTHPQSYRADGMYGQFSLVYPVERLVITLTAHNEDAPYNLIAEVNKEILPRLG